MRARAPIALLALLLLGGCGADSGDAGSAKGVLEEAARTPANSADLKLGLVASLRGVEKLQGPLKLTLRGPYRSNGPDALPDLDMRMHLEGARKNVDFRLITVRDNAFVEYGGSTYEVGRELVRRYTGRGQRQQRDLRRLGIDASRWLKDAGVEDGEANGEPTRKVSGEVDVPRMLGDLNRVFRKLASSGQLPPGSPAPEISQRTIDQIDEAVEEASFEVQVGRDHILRRNRFDASFELPEELRSRAKGLEGGELSVQSDQTNVNGGQRVRPPANARPLSELLGGFGLSPALPN